MSLDESNISQLFGEPFAFVVDDTRIGQWLSDEGATSVLHIQEMLAPPVNSALRNVVYVVSDFALVPTPEQFRTIFAGSRLFWVPLASFDPAFEAAVYSLSLLTQSDYRACAQRNSEWLEFLSHVDRPMVFAGAETHVTCELGEKLNLMAPKTEARLAPGEIVTPAGYFEVGMVPDEEDATFFAGYKVNGILQIAGVLTARHRTMPDHLVELHDEAKSLIRRICAHLPICVEVKDSQLVRCDVNGHDISDELLRVTNPKYQLGLVEFSIGTNPGVLPLVDWQINSQISEGAGPLHIGIGDGLTAAHIDFVCTDCELASA